MNTRKQNTFLGGELGGKQSQKNAAIEAVKAGAPAVSGNSASKTDAVILRLGGGKSSSSSWAEREAAATVARQTGQALGSKNAAAARNIQSFEHPIATHSHECMEPQCRQPVKMMTQYKNGRMYTNFHHKCRAQNSK